MLLHGLCVESANQLKDNKFGVKLNYRGVFLKLRFEENRITNQMIFPAYSTVQLLFHSIKVKVLLEMIC